MEMLENPFVTKFMAEIAAALIIFVGGLLIGKYRERKRLHGKSLDQYDFYPYASSRENFAEFSLRDFRLGVHYFLRNTDMRAARQLIFIGEQNGVRQSLEVLQKVGAELMA